MTSKFPLFEKYTKKEHYDWYDEDAKQELELALSKAYEQGRKEKMRPDSITMDIKEFDELVVSNDARKDIIEMQKERIAQLEDQVSSLANTINCLRHKHEFLEEKAKTAKEQGKLDQLNNEKDENRIVFVSQEVELSKLKTRIVELEKENKILEGLQGV